MIAGLGKVSLGEPGLMEPALCLRFGRTGVFPGPSRLYSHLPARRTGLPTLDMG